MSSGLGSIMCLIDEYEPEIRGVKCRKRKYLILDFIREAIEYNEVQPIVIHGRKGGGKSTYAIKAVAQYFMQYEGMSCGDAYLEALRCIVHTPTEVFTAIKQGRKILIWDDAGVWLSTYFWYDPELRPYLIWFLNWYDTSRTDVNVFIFTVPHLKKLPPRVRDDPEMLRVRVRRIGSHVRDGRVFKVAEAHIVRFEESDYTDKTYSQDIGYDEFVVYLPDPVYKVYKPIRDYYHRLGSERLKKILAERGLLEELPVDI